MPDVSWHPYIVDDNEFRLLQFAEWDIQSKMRKSAPDELVLSYTQAMMAFLLFNEAPKHVLIAGLGGGSLSKFCYRHLPGTRVTTVEISQEVIDLRNEFRIPPDDERFRVIAAGFAAYIAGQSKIADVILLDGYDADGIPTDLNDPSFYAHCSAALTDDGILVANVNLGAINNPVKSRRAIRQAMGHAISIRSTAGHNDIVLGFRRTDFPAVPALKARALAWRQQTGLDFPLLLDKVRGAAAATDTP